MTARSQDLVVDEINIKLVILGQGGVGKTSIVNQLFNKDIPDRYIPTIGSNINKKEYRIKSKNIYVQVSIWDVGGQRSFNPLNPAFYNNVDAAFLVMDMSNPEETLNEIKKIYLPNLYQYAQECISFVVGNKIDMLKEENQLENIIKKYFKDDIPLLLTSALNNQNIQEIFDLLVYTYLQEWEKRIGDPKFQAVAQEFLSIIGKSEKELKELFVNVKNIKTVKIEREKKAPVSQKIIPAYDTDEAKLKQFRVLQSKISRLDKIKYEIIDTFKSNLEVVGNLISELKNTPIGELIQSVDNTMDQLNQMKDDFELSLDSLINVDEEERPSKTPTPEVKKVTPAKKRAPKTAPKKSDDKDKASGGKDDIIILED